MSDTHEPKDFSDAPDKVKAAGILFSELKEVLKEEDFAKVVSIIALTQEHTADLMQAMFKRSIERMFES